MVAPGSAAASGSNGEIKKSAVKAACSFLQPEMRELGSHSKKGFSPQDVSSAFFASPCSRAGLRGQLAAAGSHCGVGAAQPPPHPCEGSHCGKDPAQGARGLPARAHSKHIAGPAAGTEIRAGRDTAPCFSRSQQQSGLLSQTPLMERVETPRQPFLAHSSPPIQKVFSFCISMHSLLQFTFVFFPILSISMAFIPFHKAHGELFPIRLCTRNSSLQSYKRFLRLSFPYCRLSKPNPLNLPSAATQPAD